MTKLLRRRALVGVVLMALAMGCSGEGPSAPDAPLAPMPIDLSRSWVEASPSAVDMDAVALQNASRLAAGIPRFRSLLVARRGALVTEWYAPGADRNTLFDVRSATKSVVSTLAGIALSQGAITDLDAPIGDYLARQPAYTLDDADRATTLRDLLTMSSGFAWDESTAAGYNQWILTPGDHVQYLLDRPHSHPRGTRFNYNSAAVHALGVVLERATGQSLALYADTHLFEPLGVHEAAWEPLDPGTVNGGSGLKLRARDMVKIGQLFLQRGWSGTTSVVPEAWVDEAVQPWYDWRETRGPQRGVTYGYLWWVVDPEPPAASVPPAFMAWGYGGQFIYVVPSLDLVVVTTTDWAGAGAAGADLGMSALGVIVGGVLPAVR